MSERQIRATYRCIQNRSTASLAMRKWTTSGGQRAFFFQLTSSVHVGHLVKLQTTRTTLQTMRKMRYFDPHHCSARMSEISILLPSASSTAPSICRLRKYRPILTRPREIMYAYKCRKGRINCDLSCPLRWDGVSIIHLSISEDPSQKFAEAQRN